MKKDTHPKYHKNVKVTCACGNEFEVGSTLENIQVELCHLCHPFYTGKQKLVDTARRVEKFAKWKEKAAEQKTQRKGKKVKLAAKAKKQAEKEK